MLLSSSLRREQAQFQLSGCCWLHPSTLISHTWYGELHAVQEEYLLLATEILHLQL